MSMPRRFWLEQTGGEGSQAALEADDDVATIAAEAPTCRSLRETSPYRGPMSWLQQARWIELLRIR